MVPADKNTGTIHCKHYLGIRVSFHPLQFPKTVVELAENSTFSILGLA